MAAIPAYRRRKDRDQALVTLTDAATGKRRDFWLGTYDSPESREAYYRVIAEWEARRRRLPEVNPARRNVTALSDGPAVGHLIREYWLWAKPYYHRTRGGAVKSALRLLRRFYGRTPARAFGPNKLRLLREEMIRGDASADPPRPPWSRRYINSQLQCIRHMFKWAAAREMVPASIHQALCTLEPLRRGRSAAVERPKVAPVPQRLLDGVCDHLSRPVRALVELQLLTGARPGELLGMRPADIEMDEQTGIWTYRPETHKNDWRETERVIYLGPRAQAILRPFLTDRPTSACLFSPAEADAERRAALNAKRTTPLSCGNRPGTNRRAAPIRTPGERYTTDSYRRAIEYACEGAFPPPAPLTQRADETRAEWRSRLTAAQQTELRAWRRAHRWHPHQLRHNAATLLRREFGLEAAQLTLGHASAQITDAVYAERDRAKVIEIMRKIG